MPWKGMNATVGDYTVVVNKKWNFQGGTGRRLRARLGVA